MNLGRSARLLMMILPWFLVASAGEAKALPRAVPTPQGIVLTGGKISLDFGDGQSGFITTNLNRLDELVWSGGSGALAAQNLVAEVTENEGSTDAEDIFGQSQGVFGDPQIVGPGYAAVASNQTTTTLTTTTSGTRYGTSDGQPAATTDYTVYAGGDPDENEFRVSRTIDFSSATPLYQTSGVRPYIPDLSISFGIVLYPNAAGAIQSLDSSSCNLTCEVTDWNGKWFAEDDDSGSGMVVFRDAASTAPAELAVSYEEESLDNLTAIAVLQPAGGFTAPLTEVEWLCFYDPSTWTSADQQAGNLPQGCAQLNHTASVDTTPDAFSFTAVTGVAPESTQTSNTVTITGINSAAPVTVSGGTFSVDGGAYGSAATSINDGDTITLRGIAAASYATSTSVLLTIGGVEGAFAITTKAAPAAPSVSLQTSSTSLVMGQTGTLTWSSANATACTAGGAWEGVKLTAGTATVAPQAAGTAVYTLTCSGAGGSATSQVSIGVSAETTSVINGHVGGGGSLEMGSLFILMVLFLIRAIGAKAVPRAAACAAGAICFIMLISPAPVRAQDSTDDPRPYLGIRAGLADYQYSVADLRGALGTASGEIDSAAFSKHQFGGMLYGGVPIYRSLMLELGYTQLGQFPLSIKATSADTAALAQRILGQLAPAGHGVTAGLALPLAFGSTFSVEPRLSALYYQSKQVVATSTGDYRSDLRGLGVDAGLSLTFRVAAPIDVGIGADCLHMTQACNVLLYTAQVEYRFGRR